MPGERLMVGVGAEMCERFEVTGGMLMLGKL